jgi:hypothetical protein
VYEHEDGSAFDAAGGKKCRIAAVVAEVSNTPWNEMHPYVMHPHTVNMTDQSSPLLMASPSDNPKDAGMPRARSSPRRGRSAEPPVGGALAQSPEQYPQASKVSCSAQKLVRFDFPKTFHVSPFMPMQQSYNWSFTPPGRQLLITGRTRDEQGRMFSASFAAEWSPITAGSLWWHLLSMPLVTVMTVLGILWQAMVVWFMGIPSFDHPRGKRTGVWLCVYAAVWPAVAVVRLLCPGTHRDSAQRLADAFTMETE